MAGGGELDVEQAVASRRHGEQCREQALGQRVAVAQEAGESGRFAAGQAGDREFDGKLGAVAAQGGELEAPVEDRRFPGLQVALERVACAARRGPGMISSSRRRPSASSRRKPNVRSAAGFQSTTHPAEPITTTASSAASKTPPVSGRASGPSVRWSARVRLREDSGERFLITRTVRPQSLALSGLSVG
jgi:hypothetical protein